MTLIASARSLKGSLTVAAVKLLRVTYKPVEARPRLSAAPADHRAAFQAGLADSIGSRGDGSQVRSGAGKAQGLNQ